MDRRVVYFHFNRNEVYKKYLLTSVASVKRNMGELTVKLFGPFTREDFGEGCGIDEIVTTDAGREPWKHKIELMAALEHEQVWFLDSDTFLVEPVWELFALLDRFDLVATFEHHYIGRMSGSAPVCFPELNYGMFLWRRNDATREFFGKALDIASRRSGGCDQPCMRVALWESPAVRYAVVPWEYNCRYHFPGYLFGKAKILHAHTDDFVRDEELINRRVYPGYPPFKRVLTSEKVLYLKKRWPRTQAILDIVEEVQCRWGWGSPTRGS